MQISLPLLPSVLELPDDWHLAAGMVDGWSPRQTHYTSKYEYVPVLLSAITPPARSATVQHDWRGFCRDRYVSALSAMISGIALPPIKVQAYVVSDLAFSPPYQYWVRDGFHRYYASLAAGFQIIPVKVD